jgi:hypothetical protein
MVAMLVSSFWASFSFRYLRSPRSKILCILSMVSKKSLPTLSQRSPSRPFGLTIFSMIASRALYSIFSSGVKPGRSSHSSSITSPHAAARSAERDLRTTAAGPVPEDPPAPHEAGDGITSGTGSPELDRLWILDPVFPVLSLDVLLQRHAVLLVTGQGKQDCTKLGQATQLYV